jgi:signal transduction histidine kinase
MMPGQWYCIIIRYLHSYRDAVWLTMLLTPKMLQQAEDVNPHLLDSSRSTRFRSVTLALLIIIGPAISLASWFVPALNRPIFSDSLAHVIIAGASALLAIILAFLVLQAARRARDSRVLLIGMALLACALIFLVHAIATPNVMMIGYGKATGLSALLSLVAGGIGFGLSAFSVHPILDRLLMQHARKVILLLFCSWAVLVWWMLSTPTTPAPSDPAVLPTATSATTPSVEYPLAHDHTLTPATLPPIAMQAFFGLGVIGYSFAVWRYYRLYRQAPSEIGQAVLYGITFFGIALMIQHISVTYSALFWIYHLLEMLGSGVITTAVLLTYRRRLLDETLLENLFLPGTRARIQTNYAHALDELIALLAGGEQPTTQLRRTLQERFGLGESQVQALERAAAAVAQERQQRAELEQLNMTLRQLEYDKEQLTQMVVHDLKNPLTAIVGFLEILHHGQLTPDQNELVEGGLRSGKNLSGLIGDLLDIAKMREGHLTLNRSSIAMHALLHDCATELHYWADQDAKTINIECDQHLRIYADQRLLRRILLNLISNAIKHTPMRTHILIRAVHVPQRPGWNTLEVIDNGNGIAVDRLDRIFERFESGSSAPTARQESTGLGLAFCRMATAAHDGVIEVESTINQGTTFRILLPNNET